MLVNDILKVEKKKKPMAHISFSLFLDKIANGEKTQTIRSERPVPIEVGDSLSLYAWSSDPKLILSTLCTDVKKIEFGFEYALLFDSEGRIVQEYREKELDGFASAEGFEDWLTMARWHDRQHGLPFAGVLIKWT